LGEQYYKEHCSGERYRQYIYFEVLINARENKAYPIEIGQLLEDRELLISNKEIPMMDIVHVNVIGVMNFIISPKRPKNIIILIK